MADPASATGSTVSDVTARIEGLLAGEESPGNQPPAAEQKPGEAEGDAPAENADQQAQETDQPEETGEELEDGDAEPGEKPPSVASDDQLYTIKVDGGEPEQVTVKEMAEGYIRKQTFFRRMETLANERKAFEPERQAALQERQQYAQMLPLVQQFLQAQLPPEPNPALMDQDPIEYARQNNLYTATQRRLQAAIYEQQRLAGLQAQQFGQQQQQTLKEGREKLHEAVPEWKDQKKWEADRTALAKFALSRGYSEDEVAQATDPRAILLLRDAMELERLKAKKPEQAPQRGPRPLAAGPAQQGQNNGLRKARQTLKQTGRVEDAAAAILRAGLV